MLRSLFPGLAGLLDAAAGFLAARAAETLAVVAWLGDSPARWFLVGFAVPFIFLIASRFVAMLPDERGWPLFILKSVGWVAAWSAVWSVGVAALWLAFAFFGGDLSWSKRDQVAFWPFVWHFLPYTFAGFLSGIVAGFVARTFAVARSLEPMVARWLHLLTAEARPKGELGRTDARTVAEILPKKIRFNLDACFEKARQRNTLFLGVGADGLSVLVDLAKFVVSHIQIVGPTGTGKGVQWGVIVAQLIALGKAVISFDPKLDEWSASLEAEICEKHGKRFQIINLRQDFPQVNPLRGITGTELVELFEAGFSLGEKGGDSDFYRLSDRKAARQLAAAVDQVQGDISLPELFDRAAEFIDPELMDAAKGFLSRLEEVAEIPAIHTREGADLAEVVKNGGVLHVAGVMRGQARVTLQKMLALRAFQIVENRGSKEPHVSIFLDEIKYLLSMPVVNSFGTIRDKGCNLLLSHQALQDFRDIPDVDPTAAEGALKNNTQIKWIYRSTDPETVEWATSQTGTVLVDSERRQVVRNEGLAQTVAGERVFDQVERPTIDANMLQSLPDACALVIGAGPARLAITQPVEVNKRDLLPEVAPAIERIDPSEALLQEVSTPPLPEDPPGDLQPSKTEEPTDKTLCEKTPEERGSELL